MKKKGKIQTDRLIRYLLSTDGSIFKKEPAAVVYPENREDVIQAVEFALENRLTVHPRGAGSGLCGSSLGSGLIIDFTRYMNRLIKLDLKEKYFECEPGYRAGELEFLLKGSGLFFPPDPSSSEFATFGGMYSTNASGARSVKYGNVSDYILDAEIVTGVPNIISLSDIETTPYNDLPDNFSHLYSMYTDNKDLIENSYPDILCNSAGYNLRGLVQNSKLCLKRLFAGSEGTLGIATKLKFKLISRPAYNSLLIAFFDNITDCSTGVSKLMPLNPSGIEIMDKSLLRVASKHDRRLKSKQLERADCLLMIEFDSSKEVESIAEKAASILKKQNLAFEVSLAKSDIEKQSFWTVRKAAVPILYKLKGKKKIIALIEDAAVPLERIHDYFKGIYKILAKVKFVVYGHISKGLLHTRPFLDLKDKQDIKLLKTLADQVFDLVHQLGGVISGEHGDGRLRTCYIEKAYPEIYDLFLKTKRLLDKNNIFNPEIKTFQDPFQMQKDLRFGKDYNSEDNRSPVLRWPENFVNEVEKCHGCSKCTTITKETRMCPVYKVTRFEEAAPKSKANILRGILSGELNKDDLYKDEFQKIISYCLNCGTCFKDCPSNVNIPKLAIEAKARYIEKFGPSLSERFVSDIGRVANLTHRFSGLLKPVNRFARFCFNRFAGIDLLETVAFSSKSLYQRVGKVQGKGDTSVIYFAGCYFSFIRPDISEAAIKILNSLDIKVYIPKQQCCGLPMFTGGMIQKAQKRAIKNIESFNNLISKVDYIVTACPSCNLMLKEKWSYFLKGSKIENISKKVVLITSLINSYSLNLNYFSAKAGYHTPCHLKLQEDPLCSIELLSKIPGLDVSELNTNCCGMAGTWGLYSKNFALSKKLGKDVVSALRESSFGITDCPTCAMQMERFGNKKILHPVELIYNVMFSK